MNRALKTVIFWAVIVCSSFLLWQSVKSGTNQQPAPEISYSQFISQVADGQIAKVTIAGNVVRGYDNKGAAFKVISPSDHSMMLQTLQQHGVQIWFKEMPEQGWTTWFMSLAPLILLAVLWFFMIRQMKRRTSGTPPGSPPPPETQNRFGP